MTEFSPFVESGYWLGIKDGDPRAYAIYMRHYSARLRRHIGDYRIAGPGQHMILLTYQCDALFGWRKFRSMDGQEGVSCFVFRNEGSYLASDLIREAMDMAWARKGWEHERLFTYVAPRKIRSVNPGYCFKKAGWNVCGTSLGGLVILEALPC